MRARLILALVLTAAAALTAGCLGPDGSEGWLDREVQIVDGAASAEGERGEDEYWMVWVRGNETDERDPQAVCARQPPNYRLHPGNETVVYDNRSYDFTAEEVTALVAYDHEDRSSGCAEIERLVANPREGHVEVMGEYGDVSITIRDDGTLLVDERAVLLGEAAEVTYEGTPPDPERVHVEGSFRAEVLGAWPQDRLEAGDP